MKNGIEFKRFTEFPRGTLYDILQNAYSFDSRNKDIWDENWHESDGFFYNNPEIADKSIIFSLWGSGYEKRRDNKSMYERFIGNYAELKPAWYDFMDRHADALEKNQTMIERFYDDPKVVEVNQCICDLCIPTTYLDKGEASAKENIATIAGGKFAVYHYVGKIDGIYTVLQGIFSIWLPQSTYKMDERYGINIYREVKRISDQVVMDLCIPIQ